MRPELFATVTKRLDEVVVCDVFIHVKMSRGTIFIFFCKSPPPPQKKKLLIVARCGSAHSEISTACHLFQLAVQIDWHDWWRCVTQDEAGRTCTPSLTRAHKSACVPLQRKRHADSCTVCASSAPSPVCQQQKKTSSRAKSDLTFSNTESAERAGERDAGRRRQRDGEDKVEGVQGHVTKGHRQRKTSICTAPSCASPPHLPLSLTVAPEHMALT